MKAHSHRYPEVTGEMVYDRGLLRIDWPRGPRWYPIWHLRDTWASGPLERKVEIGRRLDFLISQIPPRLKGEVKA